MNINDIKTIAVIGAGDMGHGIAEAALIVGYTVYLQDINQKMVDRGVTRIHESLQKLVEKNKVPAQQHELIKSELLHACVDLSEAVKDADLVIEAIPEIMELKKDTFRQMDAAAPEQAILASNTSTMKITEIASVTTRPAQVLGLHYFNPAVLMKLVEVIRAEKTSEETIRMGIEFVRKNNKVAVRVEKDVPGFIVNRVQAPGAALLNCILDEGLVEPEAVDATMRNLGFPMGPYETMDYTGLDINHHANMYFAETVHPDFTPGRILSEKVNAGELGKKSGKGLFDWSGGRPEIDLSKTADNFDPLNLVAVNVNEATKIVEMGVCSLDDVDTAIVNATGSPAGIVAIARDLAPQELSRRLEQLAEKYNKEIFKPSRMIIEGTYR